MDAPEAFKAQAADTTSPSVHESFLSTFSSPCNLNDPSLDSLVDCAAECATEHLSSRRKTRSGSLKTRSELSARTPTLISPRYVPLAD